MVAIIAGGGSAAALVVSVMALELRRRAIRVRRSARWEDADAG